MLLGLGLPHSHFQATAVSNVGPSKVLGARMGMHEKRNGTGWSSGDSTGCGGGHEETKWEFYGK